MWVWFISLFFKTILYSLEIRKKSNSSGKRKLLRGMVRLIKRQLILDCLEKVNEVTRRQRNNEIVVILDIQ